MKSESDKLEAKTFPCAECGEDVATAKLSRGPDHVFCRASHERRFRKRGFADTERRQMLAEYHYAAKQINSIEAFNATGKNHNRRWVPGHDPATLEPTWRCDADYRRISGTPPPNAPESWQQFFEIMRTRGLEVLRHPA
jgi:hypothetical protein